MALYTRTCVPLVFGHEQFALCMDVLRHVVRDGLKDLAM
jgi:hypothetical protein